ncbi:MAG: manganese efflux pump MntP family protein [Clostridia bacterium]
MNLWELLLIAVALSMDAFAVSVCKGLSVKKVTLAQALKVGIYFGGFQASMPLLGYFLGSRFSETIKNFDHWIAFFLLLIIGANMIKESRSKNIKVNSSFNFKTMLLLAVATSIDALAVGVTFAFLNVSIVTAVSFIGIITFILSIVGVKIGNIFGAKHKSTAEFIGGMVLIFMGLKILLEHLSQ